MARFLSFASRMIFYTLRPRKAPVLGVQHRHTSMPAPSAEALATDTLTLLLSMEAIILNEATGIDSGAAVQQSGVRRVWLRLGL